MKIYLVAPKNPESFWTFDRILDTVDAQCMFSNLALPTIAALTPPGHEVVLCDENADPIDFDTDADIVGVTGYIIHQKRMKEILDEFRRRGKFVAVGGPYASLCPDDLAAHADVVFVDEAEETWPLFLEDYAAGRHQKRYIQEEKSNMEQAPLPRFDLLNLAAYRTVCVQFARGCPFTCEFCDIITIFGRRPRAKSIPQTMAEIEELHRLGVERIFSWTTTSSGTASAPRPSCAPSSTSADAPGSRSISTPRSASMSRRTTRCSACSATPTSRASSSASRRRGASRSWRARRSRTRAATSSSRCSRSRATGSASTPG